MQKNIRLFAPTEDSARTDDATTVAEVIRLYLDHMAERVRNDDYTVAGLYNARHDLESFATRYGFRLLSDCRQSDLSDWLAANPRWQAVATKKRAISCVVNCFGWAFDEEITDLNPFRRLRALRGIAEEVRRPATVHEYVTLMRFGARQLRRGIFFLRRTGARTCEMRELLFTDLRLDGPSLHIILGRHKTSRRTGQARFIGLDPATAHFLANLRAHAKPGQTHVFVNRDGRPWNRCSFARLLRRTAQRLGLDDGQERRVSAYCFRHLYTVQAIEAGIGERQIADQLGHTKTDLIGRVYGKHTRQREEHLSRVATDINRKRRKEGQERGRDNAV